MLFIYYISDTANINNVMQDCIIDHSVLKIQIITDKVTNDVRRKTLKKTMIRNSNLNGLLYYFIQTRLYPLTNKYGQGMRVEVNGLQSYRSTRMIHL